MARTTSSSARAFWRSWKGIAIGGVVAALVAASFVLPSAFSSDSGHSPGHGTTAGEGLSVGTAVPGFREIDLQSGHAITSDTLSTGRTLLFFSEGVMCQACFEQIRGLEALGAQLRSEGVRLVSITPDSPDELRAAMRQYGITTPVISDSDRTMSEAFNVLGKGMHSDTPGHAFAFVEDGHVAWYHDYWLPPDRAMYVDPAQVLAALPIRQS